MGLSEACLNQHARENTRTWRWLASGSLGAVGLWFGLFLLPERTLPPTDITTLDRIELIVTNVEEPPLDLLLPEPALSETSAATPTTAPAIFQTLPQNNGLVSSDLDAGVADSAVPNADQPASTDNAGAAPDPDTTTPDGETQTPGDLAIADSLENSENNRADKTSPLPTDSDEIQPETAESSEQSNDNSVRDSLLESLRRRPSETATETTSNAAPNFRLGARRSPGSEATGRNTRGETGLSGADSESRDRNTDTAAGSGTQATTTNGNAAPRRARRRRQGALNTVECRRCEQPDYPEAASTADVEGNPLVEAVYDASGNVTGARLVRSSGNAALDQAAIDAVESYEFEAGGRSGRVPVEAAPLPEPTPPTAPAPAAPSAPPAAPAPETPAATEE